MVLNTEAVNPLSTHIGILVIQINCSFTETHTYRHTHRAFFLKKIMNLHLKGCCRDLQFLASRNIHKRSQLIFSEQIHLGVGNLFM